jgi:hypothetical protein
LRFSIGYKVNRQGILFLIEQAASVALAANGGNAGCKRSMAIRSQMAALGRSR